MLGIRKIKIYVDLIALVTLWFFSNIHAAQSQSKVNCIFTIDKNKSCAETLKAASNRYGFLIAFSPSLDQIKATANKILIAESITALIEKICLTYQLEYVDNGDHSYLVRSELKDIENAVMFNLHLKIRDNLDGQPLSYASIYDDSRKYFAFSDDQGDCFIKLPKSLKGNKLYIHSLSHQDKVLIIDPEQAYRDISLVSKPVDVFQVTIQTAKRSLSLNKNQSVLFEKTMMDHLARASIFTKDVLRSMQLMSGINSTNDASSSLRIRGSNEEATLLVLDNMPIYKADHFYGLFGAFNGQFIDKVSLYKNNIPIEYGGRTSGMLKLEGKNSVNKFSTIIDLNLLNSGIASSIPFSENSGIIISGRKTYTDLVKTKLYDLKQRDNVPTTNTAMQNIKNLIVSKPAFDFYDFNTKLFFNTKKHFIDLNLFRSSDRFVDKYNITYKRKNMSTNEELFKQESKWDNMSFGINYAFHADKYDITANVYNTKYSSSYDIFSFLIEKFPGGEFKKDTVTILNNNFIKDSGGKIIFHHKGANNIQIGLEHITHDNELYLENDKKPILEINKNGNESSIFGQFSVGKKEGLLIQPAFRSTYFPSLDKIFVLPQLFVSFYIDEKWMLKSSFGRQVQLIRQLDHENLLGQKQQFFAISNGNNIPIGIGRNYMLGSWRRFSKFSMDLEAYYRTLDGAITHVTRTPGLRQTNNPVQQNSYKLFSGYSRVFGVDLSMVYENKSFLSMVNYTLSKSENKFNEIFNNQYFTSAEDSRHQFKWLNVYSYANFDFSLTLIGASGRPYLDLSVLNANVDRNKLQIRDYIKRLPDYSRVDLGIGYKLILLKQKARIGMSVFNLFDHTNVKYRQFVFQLPPQNSGQNPFNTILGSDVSQLDRTLNLSLSITIE
ncbi:MAG: TonB-dependent receptor plug domain-containing protein [Saprospiraceae bacterium]|nr:TonB-dependent receptor plug domain-containing protein [Saprospiraceae bacterium]